MKELRKGKLVRVMNTHLKSNRVRFNWGFHDANFNFERESDRIDGLVAEDIERYHFDPVYAKGYVSGWNDSKNDSYNGSSNKAWEKSGIEQGYADHVITPLKKL